MDPLAMAGSFLCVELGKFSVADFVISKAADIGTGKLWREIKKRFCFDKESVEASLYDAVEASVRRYSELNDRDEIAPACEMLYAVWIVDGRLSEEQVKKALGQVNSRYIAKRNVKLWYSMFYEEVAKKEMLYRWFVLQTTRGLGNQKSKNEEVLEQMKEILGQPLRKGGEDQEKRLDYEEQIKAQIQRPILGEPFCLRDIYVSLHGKNRKRNVLQPEKAAIVDTTSYIWKWFQKQDSRLLFLYGEPGSGKSSIVKMTAATIAASGKMDGMVVFIDLHKLAFSDKEPALKVVVSYVEAHSPWFFEKARKETRLLVLDGLDEIKYKVYENASELVRQLDSCDWEFPYKIIVSGRTQIILKSMEDIRCEELEVLPLYLDEDDIYGLESRADDPEELLKEDLRQEYWNTLMQCFGIQQEMPVLNRRFDELSKSPLLLFLMVWTTKYAGIQFSELKNAAELYENIFRYIYTREYNRASQDEIYFKSREYLEYQQMLRDLGACAFRNNSRSISISAIYEYCTKMGREEVCQRWIQKHKEDNPSKLVLFFFLREIHHEMDWNESEIEFIHKTFYEYLAAVAIIEFLYKRIEDTDSNDFLPLMVFLLSKNVLGGEIPSFIGEIIENESLEIDGERITVENFGRCLSDMVTCGFNVDYPFAIGKEAEYGNRVYVQSYSEMMQAAEIYENNMKILLETVTGMEAEESNAVIDLSAAEFQKVKILWWKFDGCLLEEAHLEESYLSGASFQYCNLRGAVVLNAVADRTSFCHADLSDADFSGSQMAAANFTEAIVKNTDFELTGLEGAYFCDTILEGTKFASADLTAANFDNTVLRGADFHGTDLTRADFSNAILENAAWENCIMEGTILYGVKLSRFDLDNPEIIEMLAEADLSGADWTDVTEEQRRMLLREEED